jgi:hypothetical protein
MAFDRTKLSLLASSGRGRVFSYTTPDSAATVKGAGYFNSAWADMPQGTRLLVNAVNGTVFFTSDVNASDPVTGVALLHLPNFA